MLIEDVITSSLINKLKKLLNWSAVWNLIPLSLDERPDSSDHWSDHYWMRMSAHASREPAQKRRCAIYRFYFQIILS